MRVPQRLRTKISSFLLIRFIRVMRGSSTSASISEIGLKYQTIDKSSRPPDFVNPQHLTVAP
jgi:hypothetical protein